MEAGVKRLAVGIFASGVVAAVSIGVGLIGASYSDDGLDQAHLHPANEFRRPTEIPFPDDNPYSEDKERLGKTLFFDRQLSASGAFSCATCHSPSYGWEDGMALAIGHGFKRTSRHTPTILNLAWGELFFWDGRAASLEEQALGPIAAPGEMNLPLDEAEQRVRQNPTYQRLFADAFPGQDITLDTIAKAIATYERTIVSAKAPFDKWVEGDADAISPAAQRGFQLFNGKGNCSVCHAGWRFTDDGFHDVGLASQDKGRASILPGVPVLEHAFKTPTLRNIAQRAPYMHDGSIATLREVVDFYNDGFVKRDSLSMNIKELNLTDGEIDDIVSFLETLSSKDAPVTMPSVPLLQASNGE